MKEPINVHKIFAEYFTGCEALAYALSSKLSEGNICLDIERYKEELALIEEQKAEGLSAEKDTRFWVSPDEFEKQCIPGAFVTHSNTELKPFVIQNRLSYLHRYFQYETQIIENIRRLGERFKIITGGPGTGKTYSVSTKLVEMFKKNIDLKVALAAPTGKAAARMNESIKDFAINPKNQISDTVKDKMTGLKAQTIHRFLGYIHGSVFFRYDKSNPLPYDVVIIDECSMIDGALMAKLLNAIGNNTTLYLLGDKGQLASVEAGSVFGDICQSSGSDLLKDKIEIMKKSWRFDPDKGIGKFSREVIKGTFSDINSFDGDEQIKIDLEYKKELFRENALRYLDYIREPDIEQALRKLNLIRFLCVTRVHEQSVAETNKKIEKLLKNELADSSVFYPTEGFYHNQPIIITQNDYTLNVFNGDVGLIRKDGDTLYVHLETSEGEIRKFPAGYLNHYDTVFAMTIHKSQGSEFENVVLILPEKRGKKLLTRELLYTGVTRAKSRVLIQSTAEALLQCVVNQVSRASGIQERLKSEQ